MADKETVDEKPKNIYEARLFQVAEVHTETFEISADNEKEAKGRAEEILKTKDLDDVDHRLEIVDVTADRAAGAAPSSMIQPQAADPAGTPEQIQQVAEQHATSPAVAEQMIREGQAELPAADASGNSADIAPEPEER
jgi:hypothetical protein